MPYISCEDAYCEEQALTGHDCQSDHWVSEPEDKERTAEVVRDLNTLPPQGPKEVPGTPAAHPLTHHHRTTTMTTTPHMATRLALRNALIGTYDDPHRSVRYLTTAEAEPLFDCDLTGATTVVVFEGANAQRLFEDAAFHDKRKNFETSLEEAGLYWESITCYAAAIYPIPDATSPEQKAIAKALTIISEFDERCEAQEYPDVGEVWDVMGELASTLTI